ncbi:uncharacterized protein B0J16DRAFT_365471 [Fusarium flagelliforme]|uniref:uncharacterized protein n=1 Tax=Fusarium flagelliforme TaxID=2675880 RepID=UPI001E8E9CD4|nr:uncharacterized protein B0J16DRAFT_365471 [Fusarium flagelliforme]KAH7173920.1 hypothetical protein B0J16DRAFT_365471 [Fusarium flagelliforme]
MGGYVYDGDTDKLVQPGGNPIDISLRSTCRSIALETQDFPFSPNTITFSTVYREDWQKQAVYLNNVVMYSHQLQLAVLTHLRYQITPDMYHHSNADLGNHMSAVKAYIYDDISREARNPSTRYCFDKMSRRTRWDGISATKVPSDFAAAVDHAQPGWSASHSALDFFDLTFLPWAIPSLVEATALAEEWKLVEEVDLLSDWGPIFRYRRQHIFSASSVAIRFLNQVTKRQRLCIRHLIINESRLSRSFPERHPIGLIPFCRGNPKLYIDHRINLWRNFIMRTHGLEARQVAFCAEHVFPDEMLGEGEVTAPYQVSMRSVLNGFVGWMVNTMEILDEWMPLASYTLTLDGDPDLNHSTGMFTSLLKHTIARLTTNSGMVTRGIFTAPGRPDYPFMTRQSMTEIPPVAKRSSVLQCNFTLDQP